VNALPQPRPDGRAPRFNLADIIPAVLRFEDGRRTQGQLEVISLTGGMLSLPEPVEGEHRVKLLFVTPTGPVLGTAEMLKPVSLSQQPFRFIALEHDDQHRLQTSIQTAFTQTAHAQEEWIQKYRAARDNCPQPRRQLFSIPLAGLALALLSVGSAIYLFSIFNMLSIDLK